MHGMGDQNRQVCLTIKWIGKVFTQLYHTVINYKLHIYRIDNFALYLYLKSHLSALLAADFILSVALLPGNISHPPDRHPIFVRYQFNGESPERNSLFTSYDHVDQVCLIAVRQDPKLLLFDSRIFGAYIQRSDSHHLRIGTDQRPGLRSYTIEIFFPRFEAENFMRSEEHTSELQSRGHLVCRLLLEKKKKEY